MAEISPEEALSRFQLPSFSQSIKYFGIAVGDKVRHFDVSKADLKEIKAFANRSTVAAGPEAVQSVRKRAIRDTLIGVLCTVAGVILTLVAFSAVANRRGGRFTIFYGLAFFGLIMLGKGIHGFVRYRNLQRISATPEGDDRPA